MARCISPITLRKGNALQTFPCGKCNFCLQSRRSDWSFRLNIEEKQSKTSHFITLTYDEKHQPFRDTQDKETGEWYTVPTLHKPDLQTFIKRLRHANESAGEFITQSAQYGLYTAGDFQLWPPIKYYAVGEYGGTTFRPHYHLIIFNIKPPVLERIPQLWGKGHTVIGTCEPASIHYTTKYVLNKKHGWGPLLPPFACISQGVGKTYLHTNGHEHKETLRNFVVADGKKQRLPRYYSEKIFSIKDRDTIRKTVEAQNDLLYRHTIEELSQVHHEPENYYDYCQRKAHELIKDKVEKKSNVLRTI